MIKITYRMNSGKYHSKEFSSKEEVAKALKTLKESKDVKYYWVEEKR